MQSHADGEVQCHADRQWTGSGADSGDAHLTESGLWEGAPSERVPSRRPPSSAPLLPPPPARARCALMISASSGVCNPTRYMHLQRLCTNADTPSSLATGGLEG